MHHRIGVIRQLAIGFWLDADLSQIEADMAYIQGTMACETPVISNNSKAKELLQKAEAKQREGIAKDRQV